MNLSIDLNAMMWIDHPIEVHADGTVTDAPEGTHAPEVNSDGGTDPDAAMLRKYGWELLSGYTGQYGYRGPVMHASEYIGGRLADDILSEPGIYVAVAVTDLSVDSENGEDNIAGWAVARRIDV